ncbi:MAG: metal-sensitive transcriptional regulator [Bacteroidetes bacterium]|nr:MAG: metal-sensitive transcriptional regulator [Bacteroidota bacterium]
MLPKDLTRDIINRLASIQGQLAGIGKMLKESKDPEQILVQFKAAQKGLDRANYLLLDEVYRKALAIKIVHTTEACPGDCGNEHKLESIRRQFPALELDELTSKMKEISEIEKRIARHANGPDQ